MSDRVWLITGASRGLGRQWAIAALERGERVAATTRNLVSLADLHQTYGEAVYPIRLDVTDRAACFAAVHAVRERFGRLDVVVNNAGYGQYGFVEELAEAEARNQLDTNFFGPLWITQAALPGLREQGGGHIIQVSSIGGITAFANLSAYHASKWALEGMSQALAQEVAPFGVRVTLVEPGGFATEWIDAAPQAEPLAAYQSQREQFESARIERRTDLGDPEAARSAILAIVDADDPPLRVFLGKYAFDWARTDYAQRLAEWERWQPVAVAAHGGSGQAAAIDGMVPRGASEASPEK
jgi:NAD(P)-dependent dehydrogenase (short-subunit alcohol dehydrogenase family)